VDVAELPPRLQVLLQLRLLERNNKSSHASANVQDRLSPDRVHLIQNTPTFTIHPTTPLSFIPHSEFSPVVLFFLHAITLDAPSASEGCSVWVGIASWLENIILVSVPDIFPGFQYRKIKI
jgi:hypothetical protein